MNHCRPFATLKGDGGSADGFQGETPHGYTACAVPLASMRSMPELSS